MEFAEPAVRLLHFTPLHTDDFPPLPTYGARCYEPLPSCSVASQGPPASTAEVHHVAAMSALDTDPPMSCSLPFNYVGSMNNCNVYDNLSIDHQTPPYCGGQEQMQTTQQPPGPVPALPTATMPEYETEFSALLGGNPSADVSDMSVGPPPARLARLDGIPVRNIDTASPKETGYPSAGSANFYPGETHSSPHSPMSGVVDQSYRKNFKTYPKRSKSNLRRLMRATSPIFPDQSTPFSSLKRPPSVNSITSNRSADQFSTFSFPQSTNSDPSIYSAPNTTCGSSLNSPSLNSMSLNSPRIDSSPQSSTNDDVSVEVLGGSLSSLELEIPAKLARRISDVDKKILKLQVDRSRLLEKAHQNKLTSSGLTVDTRISDMDTWLFSEKLPEMGKAHLYIVPLGIHELDDALYDDASKLLREVGGMYLDLQTSINILRSICCKGMFIPAEISTCFAYIKSLLPENQNLKLSNLEGVYSIQLDTEEPLTEGVLPMEFTEALEAANKVLKCAQHITQSYMNIQMELLKMRQVASAKLEICTTVFNKLDLAVEKRTPIRAVMEGNCTTMASAERVWPQYYHSATQTIKIITGCIHPSSSL